MIPLLPAPRQIAAIIPYYGLAGDSTRIITRDGGIVTLTSRIRTVIRHLAQSRVVDLAALKTKARLATARQNLSPLPLAPELVLVPLKVRRPRVAGDITTGYINMYAISAVKANRHRPYQATLILAGTTELPVIWTVATVQRQLALARLAAAALPPGPAPFTGALREGYADYAPELLTLAVKLADVFNEILCMKQRQ